MNLQNQKKVSAESLQPINGRLLIKVLDIVDEYEGGLELAPTSKEQSNIGLIIALPLEYNTSGPLKTGETVIFNRHSGTVLVFDKFDKNAPEYRLIKEDDIFSLIV